jgi:SAM-dependent methyltransferase
VILSTAQADTETARTPVAQADAYPDHERRQALIGRVQTLLRKYYPPEDDPYRIFESVIASYLRPEHTVLDAGCGRSASVLNLFAPRCTAALGVDAVGFPEAPANGRVRLIHGRLEDLPVASETVDLAFSRSVLEHLTDADVVYREISRVLKPGGHFVFITPNIWSYPILASRLVPNSLHAVLLEWAEGRPKEEAFPTHYQSNSFRAVRRLASSAGLEVRSLRYLAMFPNYLMFHPAAFRIGIAFQRLTSRFGLLHFLQHWILGVLAKPEAASPHV